MTGFGFSNGPLLVQALDAHVIIRMHDGAGISAIEDGGVFPDAVKSLELETVPICPNRSASIVFAQKVRNFVGLDAVMKRSDLVTEFACDFEHDRHFVGPVTMIMNQDFPVQYAGQRLQF